MNDDAQRTEAGDMHGTDGTDGTDGTSHLSGMEDAGTDGTPSPSDASFEALRRKLVAHAQRMLGSRAEAEDVVQDAWLKWHGASAADVRSPDAWLTTVTTRLAIDRLRRLRIERAPDVAG